MTDEERQRLCKILRTMEPWPCKQAADEIEQLAEEAGRLTQALIDKLAKPALAQSGVEPVAWRLWHFKDGADGWVFCSQQVAKQAVENGHFVQPLYTAPAPRWEGFLHGKGSLTEYGRKDDD
jgi:hypothetical protein